MKNAEQNIESVSCKESDIDGDDLDEVYVMNTDDNSTEDENEESEDMQLQGKNGKGRFQKNNRRIYINPRKA